MKVQNFDESYDCDENSFLWWKIYNAFERLLLWLDFILVMKINHSDEISSH